MTVKAGQMLATISPRLVREVIALRSMPRFRPREPN